ncbi:MAG: Opr family porin, partial [Halarcobacter sp.]
MKATKLSLIAILAIGIPSISSASSLQEALTSGKISGEFAVTYEQRDMDKELAKWGNYYNDTDYSVGSFALKYESGVWNNLSLTSKVRAYKTIFEGGEDEFHYQGKGDAAERFWYKDGSRRSVDLEELFLAYNYEAISVKAGRQFISTDWMNKTQDALRIDA